MDRRLVILIALLASCVYEDQCAEGATRAMGRCIRGDAAGRDGGGTDATIPDAHFDSSGDSGPRDDAGDIDGGEPDAGYPLSDVDAIAVGRAHVCARYSAGADIACIGFNDHGQLGTGRVDSARYWTPQRVDLGGEPVIVLDSSADTTCVVTRSARDVIRCFGRNDSRQVSGVPGDAPTPTARMDGILVTSGEHHTCGVAADGSIYCWGRNDRGQCGTAKSAMVLTPARVEGALVMPPIVTLAAGGETTCALNGFPPTATVYCWGGNTNGELATDLMTTVSVPPRMVSGLFSTLSLTTHHACGVRRDVEVWCWGANASAQCGQPIEMPVVPLGEAGGGGPSLTVATSREHSCAIRDGGSVWCWGARAGGVRGDGGDLVDPDPAPTMVPEIEATAIDAGVSGLTCALTTDHRVYCWGPNEGFASGDGMELRTPLLVPF